MPRTGRPRGFDRDEAVAGAMRLFWEHGYEGASLEQLRRAMGGLSSASFYAAFGSKETLYRETLERYLQSHGQVVASLRDETLSPRERIEQALRGSARMQTAASHPLGCMITLSATICSPDSETLKALTATERQANRTAILGCVRSAIEHGALRTDTDAIGLASLFDGLLVGLSIQARDGVSVTALEAGITAALAVWDVHRSAITV
jgi:AcrR family transcriptional regulator